MADIVDYYELLELEADASADAIQAAVRQCRRMWNQRAGHPNMEVRTEAEHKVAQIAEAERILLDPHARANYDAELAAAKVQPEPEPVATPSIDWEARATAAWEMGDYHTTLSAAESGLFDNDSSLVLWEYKVLSLIRLGNYQDAQVAARQYVLRDENSFRPHQLLGIAIENIARLYDERQQVAEANSLIREAIPEFLRAVELGDEMCLSELSRLYSAIGEPAESLRWASQAYLANSQDPDTISAYALALGTDAEDKISGGTTITNRKQLEYVKTALAQVRAIEIDVSCPSETREDVQSVIDELTDLVAEAEQMAWRGLRYGNLPGYEYAARTLPPAIRSSGLQ